MKESLKEIMDLNELKNLLREKGVAGAGGAGFPTYAKLDKRAETIILNAAECEPLLTLHRQCLKVHAGEILEALETVRVTVEAKEAIIGIKAEYEDTVRELKNHLGGFPGIKLHLLSSVYPMGDEVVLIYESTGKVVRPGGLPIEQGVAVFNVETMYNISRALKNATPVTEKLVTVVGEVENPVTVRVPIGTSISETVSFAGGLKIKDPVYFVGGPMMGRIMKGDSPVTKTTNAVIVLPEDHKLVLKKNQNPSIGLRRAASVCCQCQMCTDLCPRHSLGHPIKPHLFMRAAANRDFSDMNPFLDTFFCSSCGLCELYSCPQGLSPRSLIAVYKSGLREKGVKAPSDPLITPVSEGRDLRKAPEERLAARLGVSAYESDAPLDDSVKNVYKVKVMFSQHIGAPALAAVKSGDMVKKGDIIGRYREDALSISVHAPIDGRIETVTDTFAVINGGYGAR